MKANLILLQRKYARIIADFAEKEAISYDDSLDFFIILSFILYCVMA